MAQPRKVRLPDCIATMRPRVSKIGAPESPKVALRSSSSMEHGPGGRPVQLSRSMSPAILPTRSTPSSPAGLPQRYTVEPGVGTGRMLAQCSSRAVTRSSTWSWPSSASTAKPAVLPLIAMTPALAPSMQWAAVRIVAGPTAAAVQTPCPMSSRSASPRVRSAMSGTEAQQAASSTMKATATKRMAGSSGGIGPRGGRGRSGGAFDLRHDDLGAHLENQVVEVVEVVGGVVVGVVAIAVAEHDEQAVDLAGAGQREHPGQEVDGRLIASGGHDGLRYAWTETQARSSCGLGSSANTASWKVSPRAGWVSHSACCGGSKPKCIFWAYSL